MKLIVHCVFFLFVIGTATFDSDKILQNFLSLSPYSSAFSSGKNYFVTELGPQSAFTCPPASASTTPSYFLVGAEGACSAINCNGALPEGSTMR